MKFLHSYDLASSQWINTSKSHFFNADVSPSFHSKIKDVFCCSKGNIHFDYLRAPIFVGFPKAMFLQPLADKVRSKLSSWKGKSLSMMGSIELVNSVIYGSLSYSFQVYRWPSSLLKLIDKWVRNFILKSDIDKQDFVIVNWDTIFNPESEGGLQVVNFHLENKAYLLRLAWNFAYNYCYWISLIKARFLKSKYQIVGSFFSSSI